MSNEEQNGFFAKPVLAEVICYLWKHKITFNDRGCDVCGRCGKHEYYDNDFHNGKPVFKTIQYFRNKYDKLKWWYRRRILRELPF